MVWGVEGRGEWIRLDGMGWDGMGWDGDRDRDIQYKYLVVCHLDTCVPTILYLAPLTCKHHSLSIPPFSRH